jgi:hypothetical protein
VGTLTSNPKSLEEIVVQQYRDIKSRLVLRADFDPAKLNVVELTSDCPNPDSQLNQETCRGVKENQIVAYNAKIGVRERDCVGSPSDYMTTMKFALEGFPKDQLEVFWPFDDFQFHPKKEQVFLQ